MSTTLESVVNAVLAVHNIEARKRVPDHLKNTNPYSVNALWTFYLDTLRTPEGDSCPYCKMFDGKTFTGDQLRTVFPDHVWMGDDIHANVHMTLWGKDTCCCLLIRDDTKWGEPTNLDLWSQIGIDWTEKPHGEEEP